VGVPAGAKLALKTEAVYRFEEHAGIETELPR